MSKPLLMAQSGTHMGPRLAPATPCFEMSTQTLPRLNGRYCESDHALDGACPTHQKPPVHAPKFPFAAPLCRIVRSFLAQPISPFAWGLLSDRPR